MTSIGKIGTGVRSLTGAIGAQYRGDHSQHVGIAACNPGIFPSFARIWKNGLYEMNLDPATGTMIAMTGDTLDLQYVIKVCPAIFWREAVGIAKFIRRDGGSDQGIQTEANL
jgi:hypothetical protein